MIGHINVWLIWKKKCMNSALHKMLVLFGCVKSSTFELEKSWYQFNKV